MYTLFTAFLILAFALMPFGSLVAGFVDGVSSIPHGPQRGRTDEEGDAILWGVIILILLPVRVAFLVFPLNLAVVGSSISRSDSALVSAMFGLQQTFAATARAISPVFVSSLFAFSIDRQMMGGQGVWLVMVALSIVGVYLSWRTMKVQLPGGASGAGSRGEGNIGGV